MRALLRPFAIHAAYSPIETIVFFTVIGTLAYFHVLSAIKHSAFFAPSYPVIPRPALALLRRDEWVGVREHVWSHAKSGADDLITPIELQQVVFSLDSQHRKDVSVVIPSIIHILTGRKYRLSLNRLPSIMSCSPTRPPTLRSTLFLVFSLLRVASIHPSATAPPLLVSTVPMMYHRLSERVSRKRSSLHVL